MYSTISRLLNLKPLNALLSKRYTPVRRSRAAGLLLPAICFVVALASFNAAQQPRMAAGQPDMMIDAAMRAQVIEGALKSLRESYVYPEVATRMEQAIRERAAKREYEEITSARQLAQTLTEHLQAVSRDKHLRVYFSPEPLPEGMGTGRPVVIRRELGDAATQPPPAGAGNGSAVVRRGAGGGNIRGLSGNPNAGIEKVERLEGNIGLLEFSLFERLPLAADKVSEAMNKLADTDALIIDLRGNGGGASGTIRFLMSYFFDKPVHLNDYYDRIEDRTESVYTLADVPGKRYGDKPVYILTSGRTFSAAESISYSLKNLKRATIVGETTGGGAHPITPRRLNEHFSVAVPTARYISPVTKTNWEGVGVEPDVKVPARHALKVAQLAALKKIAANKQDAGDAAQLKSLIEALQNEVDELKKETSKS
ncbi:MAG TPA: S41 family peptidase [Pyrinomonadaceae bacterium]|nr:S41 family peptidase [Pyrinomonadaceae bacterium]